MALIIREAIPPDIPQIQEIRHAVKENRLSDPALVTDEDCLRYITKRGKGWVAESEGQICGFAIADLEDSNIWALFLRPEFERRGIGRKLHDTMLHWYFEQSDKTVWLSTEPDTRAAKFYRNAGWTETGPYGKNEIRFEMDMSSWIHYQTD